MTGKPLPPNAQRSEDRRVLLAYLEDLVASGRPIPCRAASPAEAAAWTSDDPAVQARAAVLCVGCAGQRLCGAYGRAYPRESGCYGGATEWERRQAARTKGTAA